VVARNTPRLAALLLLLFATPALAQKPDTVPPGTCTAKAPPPAGMDSWSSPSPLPAAMSEADLAKAALKPGQAITAHFAPVDQVKYRVPPAKADGPATYGGLYRLTLAEPGTYRADPATMWERLRPRTNNRRMLGVLQAIAAWREREAQRINIPRQRLIKDESLLEMAAVAPTTPEALSRIRGVTRGFAEGRTGTGLLAALQEALALPDAELPAAPRGREGAKPSPALISLLKVLLAAKCEEHHVAPKLLASSEELDRLAAEDEPDLPVLHGWRREVFGEDALALKSGRITLGVDGKRVKLVRV